MLAPNRRKVVGRTHLQDHVRAHHINLKQNVLGLEYSILLLLYYSNVKYNNMVCLEYG